MKRRGISRKRRTHPSAKTSASDPAGAAAYASNLLRAQYRLVTDNEPGVLLGQRVPLHDLRVALRRLRLLLRIFRPILRTTSAPRWENELNRLSHALGSARDIDVWLHFLSAHGTAITRRDVLFLNRQVALKQQQYRRVSGLLTGLRYRAIKNGLSRLLHLEIPRLGSDHPSLKKIARKAIRRTLRRSLEYYDNAYPSFQPETTHRLRIACRKARYACEFFAEILGKPVDKLGANLKSLQNNLGRVHDLDVWDALLAGQRIPAGHALRRGFSRQRKEEIRRFKKGWARLDPERHLNGL